MVALLLIPQVHHFVPHHHHDGVSGESHGEVVAAIYGHDHFHGGEHHSHAAENGHSVDAGHDIDGGHPDFTNQQLRRQTASWFDLPVAIVSQPFVPIFASGDEAFVWIEAVEFPVSHGPPKGCPSRAPPVV